MDNRESAEAALQPPPEDEVERPGDGTPASVETLWGAPGHALHPRFSATLQLHTGALMPHGAFSRNARAGVAYGGALAGEWRFDRRHALRLGAHYTRAQFTAKAADLFGPVSVDLLALRADYLWGHRFWRPYAGVGIGVTPWRGQIDQPVANRSHSGQGHALSGTVAAGVDVNLIAHVALAPERSWTYVGGNFKAGLWGAGLALRGRI